MSKLHSDLEVILEAETQSPVFIAFASYERNFPRITMPSQTVIPSMKKKTSEISAGNDVVLLSKCG